MGMLSVPLVCVGPQDTQQQHDASAVLLTRDGSTLVTGSETGHLAVWTISQAAEDQQYQCDLQLLLVASTEMLDGAASSASSSSPTSWPSPVRALAECVDSVGHLAVLCATLDGVVSKWDPKTGRCLGRSRLFPSQPTKLIVGPLSRYAMCCGLLNEIVVFDVHTLQAVSQTVGRAAVRPDWLNVACPFSYIDSDGSPTDGVVAVSRNGALNVFSVVRNAHLALSGLPVFSASLGCRHPRSAEVNPFNNRSMLLVTDTQWMLYATKDFELLVSASSPGFLGWLGGAYISPQHVVIWSKDGRGYVYKLPDHEAVPPGPVSEPQQLCATPSTSLQPSCQPPNYLQCLTSELQPAGPWEGTGALESFPVFACGLQTERGPRLMAKADRAGSVSLWPLKDGCAQSESGSEGGRNVLPSAITSFKTQWSGFQRLAGAPDPEQAVLTEVMFVAAFQQLVHAYSDGTIVVSPLREVLSGLLKEGEEGEKGAAAGRAQGQGELGGTGQAAENGGSERKGPSAGSLTLRGHTGRVTCLLHPHSHTPACDKELLLSGSSDFSVRLWDLRTGTLKHTFSHHVGEVVQLVCPPANTGSLCLRNAFCSVGRDHSVALLSLDPVGCRYLMGGHSFPVKKLSWLVADDFLVVRCTDGSAYAWQLGTGHLDRVLDPKAAEDLLEEPPTPTLQRSKAALPLQQPMLTVRALATATTGPKVLVLLVDVEQVAAVLTRNLARKASKSKSPSAPTTPLSRGGSATLDSVASSDDLAVLLSDFVLSCLMNWEPPHPLYDTLRRFTALSPPTAALAYGTTDSSKNLALVLSTTCTRWQFSTQLSTEHLLMITALVHARQRVETEPERTQAWLKATALYACDSQSHIPGLNAMDLLTLSAYWQHHQNDIQRAARTLVLQQIKSYDTDQRKLLVAQSSANLPISSADLASHEKLEHTLLLGILLSECSDAVPEEVRRSVASTLVHLAFRSTTSTHYRTAAVELIGKNFRVLNDLIDARDVLEKIVALCSGSSSTLSAAASQALLSVAGCDPDSFLASIRGELGKGKSSTIKVVLKLVRRQPVALAKQLGPIVDCIMKCLDPSTPKIREQCQQIATLSLQEMVQTYPMMSYHSQSNRMAVGYNNGHVIIYDLKTVTKWQSFAAHSHGITAIGLSNDGKMLATFSLEEATVRIWQVSGALFGILGSSAKCQATHPVPGTQLAQLTESDTVERLQLVWTSRQRVTLFVPNLVEISFDVQ
eukprot:m.49544 g.49544  ORF g.49544 m.49544 type:complete len:1232 (-) comp12086_c0_seq1:26-3721(-)